MGRVEGSKAPERRLGPSRGGSCESLTWLSLHKALFPEQLNRARTRSARSVGQGQRPCAGGQGGCTIPLAPGGVSVTGVAPPRFACKPVRPPSYSPPCACLLPDPITVFSPYRPRNIRFKDLLRTFTGKWSLRKSLLVMGLRGWFEAKCRKIGTKCRKIGTKCRKIGTKCAAQV
jgi:hypothetical protein